jgi:hypothetical protein
MFASAHPAAFNLARIFHRSDRPLSGPAAEINALLDRIRQRLYLENVPVLASWWLKTVCCAGHNRPWWHELDAAIGRVLRNQSLDAIPVEAIRDIRTWVREAVLRRNKAPDVKPLLAPPFHPDLTPRQAAPYLTRVLNQWLPGEIARVLSTEADCAASIDGGMPPLTVATALERLLRREHLSPATLELLLEAGCFSPKYIYPADLEIFRDVIMALLGRTIAPAPPVLPATLLAGEFADAVERASLVSSPDGDELHVPLDAAQTFESLQHHPVRIGSLVVTMDGRWWESARLQSGPETVIAYRPGGRLRIDFTSEHARLVVPWIDAGDPWLGAVQLPEHLSLFGREWRGRAWEKRPDRTWLHLEFSDALTIPETLDRDNPRAHRLRPASIEMAWSEVERALATRVPVSIDRLHREDLIPLAHALERLVDCLLRPWPLPARPDIERCLKSVRYLHGAVAPVYGRIPWRVLSAPARAALQRRRRDSDLMCLLAETFDVAPPAERASPPQAA